MGTSQLLQLVGGVLVASGGALILARKQLGAWALKVRGEPPTQEGETRGYGAAFMVAGDILIAIGAILVLGLFPMPR